MKTKEEFIIEAALKIYLLELKKNDGINHISEIADEAVIKAEWLFDELETYFKSEQKI